FQFGQLAISPDRQYAYASLTDLNAILRISADGQFEKYATLKTPTGLVFHDGRLFAGQWDGKVFDITEGNTSTVYALGFSGLRNMVSTAQGVLVAEQMAGEVTMLAPGNRTGAPAFASGLGSVTDMAVHNGTIYAVEQGDGTGSRVFDITAGGSFSGRTPFATGAFMAALASTGSGLYASSDYRRQGHAAVWEISRGGVVGAQQPIAAFTGVGDTMFEAVPGLTTLPEAVAAVPEPGSMGLIGAGLFALSARLRSGRTTRQR
ncbi:MAG TPA: PEP-CTERM sorting domain-containing protein, partial [Bryobacteraceae bacterium]|nr:PEP-CTERM sorting domain-containing protein [Bryobacteraceae bacterium]